MVGYQKHRPVVGHCSLSFSASSGASFFKTVLPHWLIAFRIQAIRPCSCKRCFNFPAFKAKFFRFDKRLNVKNCLLFFSFISFSFSGLTPLNGTFLSPFGLLRKTPAEPSGCSVSSMQQYCGKISLTLNVLCA